MNTKTIQTDPGNGGLVVTVDEFGRFGSSTVGGNSADYDPLGGKTFSSTTYNSFVAFGIFGTNGTPEYRTILADDASNNEVFTTSNDTTANSTFTIDGVQVQLNQLVQDTFGNSSIRTGSRLDQTYTITNTTNQTINFDLVRYVDGDLDFDGSLIDGGGRIFQNGSEILFETDAGGTGETDTTFFGIQATGGTIPTNNRWELEEYSILETNITEGNQLQNKIVQGDSDSNQFIDAGSEYDVALALRNVFSLAPGESSTYTTTTRFGSGQAAQLDITPPTGSIVTLPKITVGNNINVSWGATDPSGIKNYDVFVSVDDQAFTEWQTNVTATSAIYTGEIGKTYNFYSLATDNEGNQQNINSVTRTSTQLLNEADLANLVDLELTQTVNNSNPQLGDQVKITLSLTNKGPNTASGIKVKDLLPAGLTFNSANLLPGTYDETTGIWNIGSISNNSSNELIILATVNSTASQINTAELVSVTEIDIDSNPNNNNPNEDDQSSITFNAVDIPEQNLSKNDNNVFTVQNTTGQILKATVNERNTSFVNEIGVFEVQDDFGTVNGLRPTDSGYLEAALDQSQVVFSVLPDGLGVANPIRELNFENGSRFVFYLVQNNTTDAILKGANSPVFFSNTDNQLQVSNTDGIFTLAWSDQESSDFKDLITTLEFANPTNQLGTSVQGNPEGELIDLRAQAGLNVNTSFPVIASEAAYDNLVGFYRIEDEAGTIIDTVTGNQLAPGDAGYTKAALSLSQEAGKGITFGRDQQGLETTLEGGYLYAPFIIVDGDVNADSVVNYYAEMQPSVYFSFMGANSDQTDHIRLLGDNTFGFEDLANGGDADYNDIVVQLNFAVI